MWIIKFLSFCFMLFTIIVVFFLSLPAIILTLEFDVFEDSATGIFNAYQKIFEL